MDFEVAPLLSAGVLAWVEGGRGDKRRNSLAPPPRKRRNEEIDDFVYPVVASFK